MDLHPLVDAAVVDPSLAAEVVTPAYDAMTDDDRVAWRRSHPRSWLHVLDVGEDGAAARAILRDLQRDAFLPRAPFVAILQLVRAGRTQTGLVADLDLRDVAAGRVHAHERTRRDREDELLRHLELVGATASPVSLTHAPDAELRHALGEVTATPPHLELADSPEVDAATTAPVNPVTQRLWVVDDRVTVDHLLGAARRLQHLVVLDGHHRTAAAARFASSTGTFARLLSVLFPRDELTVRPFDRCLSVDADELLPRLAATVSLGPAREPHRPDGPGHVVVATADGWHPATLPPPRSSDVRSRLDVVRLGGLLADTADLVDPRGDPRLRHLPGLGTLGLERAVADGGVGIAMWPPTIDDVMRVAIGGGTMPPKSTYVVPKVRSGLVLVTRASR